MLPATNAHILSYDVKTLSVTVGTATSYGAMFVTEYNSSAQKSQSINTNMIAHVGGIAPSISGTTDWSRQGGTFTTSASTAYVRVRASMGNWGTAKGTVWYDGVLLEKASAVSPYSRLTSYGYDQKNNLVIVTDTLGSVTTYGYDANDDRTSVTDALNRTTTYQFDAVNRLIRVTDPLSNTTGYGYDAVGNRTVITDANGIAVKYTYDAVNRLTQITYPDSQVKYAYDSLNNRTAMTDTLGTTLYVYDEVGRPITITTPSGLAVGYGYNDAGQRSSLTYPDGKQVQYGYDAAGRLWTVADWVSRVVTYTYDYANRLTQVGTDADTYQYLYDGDGIRTRKTVNGAPTDYLWDKALSLPVVLTDTNALYLHGLGLIAQQSGVDTSYYHPDGLGTIRNLTDSTGRVIVGCCCASPSCRPQGCGAARITLQ